MTTSIPRLLVVATLALAGTWAAPLLADEPAATFLDAAPEAVPAAPPDAVPSRLVPDPLSDDEMNRLPPPALGAGELIGPLAKTMFMLCIVLGLVYLTLHKGLGKLLERQNLGKRVKVVERVNLDQRRALFLVEIDGKQMLIAAGEGGVTMLKDIDGPPPVATGPGAATGPHGGRSIGERFAEALKSKIPGAQPPVSTGLSREEVPVTKAGGAS